MESDITFTLFSSRIETYIKKSEEADCTRRLSVVSYEHSKWIQTRIEIQKYAQSRMYCVQFEPIMWTFDVGLFKQRVLDAFIASLAMFSDMYSNMFYMKRNVSMLLLPLVCRFFNKAPSFNGFRTFDFEITCTQQSRFALLYYDNYWHLENMLHFKFMVSQFATIQLLMNKASCLYIVFRIYKYL